MNLSGRILIVDDEPALCQTLARILRQTGLDVTSANDGKQALAFLNATAFDLVFLDIRMPDMSGLDVLDRIHAGQPGVPVILFTAQPDLDSALEALRRGAAEYLLKPLRPEVVIEKTQAILAARRKERRKGEIRTEIEKLQAELKRIDEETGSESAAPPAAPPSGERYLARGGLVLDLLARRLTIGGRTAELPPTAFDYLVVLARHAPEVVEYRTLVAEAQGLQVESREAQEMVKWHIHHIRQTIERDPDHPIRLINVRGTGYRLLAD